MNYPVAIAMFGWIAVVVALFVFLAPRRAALVGFLAGWMFLPIAHYTIPGLPDYTKISATCGVVLICIALFDFRRLVGLRFRLADIPMLLLCLCPFASSISNGLGVHEGLSAVFDWGIIFGAPYVVGRLYFGELSSLLELAFGILAGGLVYVPLCLWELARGPRLHLQLYGYYPPWLDQETRFGILRPLVFMWSGLMVAQWMAVAAVVGLWLWKSRTLPRWVTWLVPVLVLTTIALRSVNGWILLLLGATLLALHSCWRSAAPLIVIMLLILTYVTVRATGLWSGVQSVPVVEALIDKAKGRSIRYRLDNENIITNNVHQRPMLGFGRQMASVDNHKGRYAIRDSLWIIVFSQCGTIGLVGLMATLLAPVAVFIRNFPASRWQDAAVAPAAALAVVLVLYTTDNLANAMLNPVMLLAVGGLAGLRCTAS